MTDKPKNDSKDIEELSPETLKKIKELYPALIKRVEDDELKEKKRF